ncbi:hypothetical protein FLL45_04905 [Aliikangiella marina]|uniref:Uncharacterized protein n=1 Tax=Aliikangiella marina TaxID=1712262 RepID=A0A545TJ96_9GAMM|nr:hypothetical protein [Aliikangiella marina]TQV77288.1 hypothetical protein FLL45_04905 [Aliikangiella marina]
MKYLKITKLVSKVLLPFVIAFNLGCGSNPPVLSDFQVYKQSMNPTEGQPNYQAAKDALEKIIYSPRSNSKMRESATRLMALNLYSGKFGYYGEAEFIYWANTLGSNKGSDLQFRIDRIKKVREVFPNQKELMNNLYLESIVHCAPTVKIIPQLLIQDKNLALYYLNGVECIYPKLVSQPQLREIYSKHLELVGVRETKNLMTRGFNLYARNPTMSQFNALKETEQSALLMAKIQAFTYAAKTSQPKFPAGAYYRSAEVKKIFQFFQSDNDSDWFKGNALLEEILSDNKSSDLEKAKLFHYIAVSAYLKDRFDTYKTYKARLMELNYLKPAEKLYMDRMTMLFMHKLKRFVKGNEFVEERLVQLK